jgi:hypothetical protein
MRSTGMSFVDAAEFVLDVSKRPKTAREITAEATRRGLIASSGKTPQQTMAARLYDRVHSPNPGRLVRLYKRGRNDRPAPGPVRWALRAWGLAQER